MSRDRIDEYLDELYSRLRGDPAECRSMLAEAEAHLRDAAEASVGAGMEEDAAQQAAIAAFGSPAEVARAAQRHPVATAIIAFLQSGAVLAATGFAAIAIATIGARMLAVVTSTHWVYGAPASFAFPAAKCAHWLAVQPTAASCHAAATLENADDSFLFSLAGAAIGLVLVGLVFAAVALVRRFVRLSRRGVPAMVVWAVGATAFGGAGVALVAAGFANVVVPGHWGQGLWYVQGVVSLVFAAYFGARLVMSTSRAIAA